VSRADDLSRPSSGRILLNLAFSTQAAYAAPLILLAQNRQDDRDRAQTVEDRAVAARTQADTDFLAREIAGLRLALTNVATADDLREVLDVVREVVGPTGGTDGTDDTGVVPAP
jgi:uncharacterized membrane protein